MSNKFNEIKEEWFKQAEYDIKTADAMFKTGRYIYAVFMCHLSIEKYLKGKYSELNQTYSPKTHDLIFLLSRMDIEISQQNESFLEELNDISILTRYPSDLTKMMKEYDKERTKTIMKKTEEVINCIKTS
ncbi:MAG: HEPN domain-containing protein [bacterium]